MIGIEQVPPPLPVAIAEARAFLRIDGDAEDAMLAALVRAAMGHCESFTGQALVARAVTQHIRARSEWTRLALSPVRVIDGPIGLPPEAYAIDVDANGDGWVRILDAGGADQVSVVYQAGLAEDWNAVPEALRHGILRLVAHLFAHRDAPDDRGPPVAVAALWRPWRRMRLA